MVQTNVFSQIITYRWLIAELVSRDLRLRYRGSFFGFAWTMLNPLLFMAIYTLVFSVYLKVHVERYPVFLLAGLMPWLWLAGAVTQGTNAIVDGRAYVGKTTFPTEVLVLVPVVSNMMNFVYALPLLVLLALAYHVHVGIALIALPLLMAAQFLITLGITGLAAVLNVFLRDIQQLVGYAIMGVFYLTPIFYPTSLVPPQFAGLINGNPLAQLAIGYQSILYSATFPPVQTIAIPFVVGLVLVGLAHGTFVRYRDSLSQYL